MRAEYTRTFEPARASTAETLALERTLSELVNQACGYTPAEIALMWQTAAPRMPVPPPRFPKDAKTNGPLPEMLLAGRVLRKPPCSVLQGP